MSFDEMSLSRVTGRISKISIDKTNAITPSYLFGIEHKIALANKNIILVKYVQG